MIASTAPLSILDQAALVRDLTANHDAEAIQAQVSTVAAEVSMLEACAARCAASAELLPGARSHLSAVRWAYHEAQAAERLARIA